MGKKGKKGIGVSQRSAYLFLLPSTIILVIFVFVPLISTFFISLLHMDIFMQGTSFAGFANFKQLFHDNRVFNDTINTLYFTVMEVPVQIIVALLLATLISLDTPFNKLMRTVFYLPFICSLTAIGIVWSMLLDPNMGWLPYILGKIGLPSFALLQSQNSAMPTIAAISVWKGFGYTITLLVAAILNVPESLYEAANLDGAGYWNKFAKITVPEIWPTICFCIVTNTIGSLQIFDLPYIMTKGGPNYRTETIVEYIYDRGFQTAPYNLGYASAISVYLFVIIAVITFVLRRFVLNRQEEGSAA